MCVCTCQFKPYNTSDNLKNILEMNEKIDHIAVCNIAILQNIKRIRELQRFWAFRKHLIAKAAEISCNS